MRNSFMACLCAFLLFACVPDSQTNKAIWETETRENSTDKVSTHNAQLAAEIYFDSLSLKGKSRKQILQLIGNPETSSDSIYRTTPYFALPKNALMYRFDTGCYGWQFSIYFDEDNNALRVEKREIDEL